jgi:hypothetical protein
VLNDVTCVRLELRLVDVVQLNVLAAVLEIQLPVDALAVSAFSLKMNTTTAK